MGNHASTASDWLLKLAVELEGHVGELVDLMDESVQGQVPSYAGLPKTAGFRQGLHRTALTYCRTLAEFRAVNEQERVSLHVIGSQRARHGLVVDDVTCAVDVAVATSWEFSFKLLLELGADVETVASVATEAFPLTLAFAGDVRDALLFGFRSDGEEPLPAQVRAQAAVIDRLLGGANADEELFEVVRSQGLDIRPPVGLLVLTPAAGTDVRSLRPAAGALAQVPRLIEGPARYSATPAHLVLLASAVDNWSWTQRAVGELARSHGVVAVAPDAPVQRLVDLAGAYHSLEADLHLAKRVRREGGLVDGRTLALYSTLDHIPPQERVELVVTTLGGVLAKRQKGEMYLEAYEGWLDADCDLRRAGELLGEPEYTVRYRVGVVERLSGISARSSEGRIRLDLAVRLWRAWVREALVGQDPDS